MKKEIKICGWCLNSETFEKELFQKGFAVTRGICNKCWKRKFPDVFFEATAPTNKKVIGV